MELLNDAQNMLQIIAICILLVSAAMILDLIAGLHKAKQRGEIRSSWGLKRTLSKFISYIGGLLIAGGVDILIHCCKLFKVFHLEVLYGLPVFTCLIGIFLLVVEFLSVREAADEKTKTEMSRVAKYATKIVNKDELVEALTQAIINANKSNKQ